MKTVKDRGARVTTDRNDSKRGTQRTPALQAPVQTTSRRMPEKQLRHRAQQPIGAARSPIPSRGARFVQSRLRIQAAGHSKASASPPIVSDSRLGAPPPLPRVAKKKSARIHEQNNIKMAAIGRAVGKWRAREVGVFLELARRLPAAAACYKIYLTYFRDELDIDIYSRGSL